MPPRKGMATVKKAKSKYTYVDSDGDERSGSESRSSIDSYDGPVQSSPTAKRAQAKTKTLTRRASEEENIDPAGAREPPKLSNKPQPRQDSPTSNATMGQSAALQQPPTRTRPPTHHSPARHSPTAAPTNANTNASLSRQNNNTRLSSDNLPTRLRNTSPPPTNNEPTYPDTMIQGGASIPTNQHRNMRACMVCSVVRTQQQFLTGGCPNCEDILELIGNPEQINDCTSQVFEGLISVADTNRSWVARYQRLEGYVPGVYATQVEGILPEDVLVAVESAGINYVPRDGSEQEMLGKD